MGSTLLSRTCSDEEVVDFALHHYFLQEELVEAQRMLEMGSTYEEAIAYLAECGHAALRNSGEERPPRIFLTIPGGSVSIYHPARPFPEHPIKRWSVGHLASLVLPRPLAEKQPAPAHVVGSRYQSFSLFDDVVTPSEPKEHPRGKIKRPAGTRSKKPKYVQQPVRMGTKKSYWTRPGWVVKDGGLAYVLETRKSDWHEITLVHIKSNHIMASVYLSALDETTHTRIQGWLADALQLTDWSKGIATILKEKTGDHKKDAWSRELEGMWMKHRTQPYQASLFDTDES